MWKEWISDSNKFGEDEWQTGRQARVSRRIVIDESKRVDEDQWKRDREPDTLQKPDARWGNPVLLQDISSKGNEGCISVTRDRKKVYVALAHRDEHGNPCSYFPTCSGSDLYEAECDSLLSTFTNIQSLGSVVNSPYWDSHPSISPSGDTLYFASNRPGGKGDRTSDIWMARKVGKEWISLVNLGVPINTPGNEYSPFIASDGRTLYFASDGQEGHQGLDIYKTVRDSNGIWGKPERLPEPVNSVSDDYFPCTYKRISTIYQNVATILKIERFYSRVDTVREKADTVYMYLASGREHGCGGLDLYLFPIDTIRQRDTVRGFECPVRVEPLCVKLEPNNVCFFVTGYYRLSTRENLDSLVKWLSTKFKGQPIEYPGPTYFKWAETVEKTLDTIRAKCDSIFRLFRQSVSPKQITQPDQCCLEIEVNGYTDPRPIRGKYVEEDIDTLGIKIKKGTTIDNPVLSQLRAYYTTRHLMTLFDTSSDDYRKLRDKDKDKIKFIPIGKSVDVGGGPYEAQRRITITIRLKAK